MKRWDVVVEKCTFFPIFKQVGMAVCTARIWAFKHDTNHISELFQLAKWFKNDYFEKSKFNSLEIN